MDEEGFLIGSIPKGRDELRVQLKEFRGTRYCDLRIYYPPKEGGELKHTSKGVTVGLKQITRLRELLAEAEQLARDKDWF